ncbi:MAG TPA: PfkB family carbohydrate kinase [Acidimicrobiales bacterium]|nr:PfkB family carbohydrate kinase [Acidimicrobiales bacterium]
MSAVEQGGGVPAQASVEVLGTVFFDLVFSGLSGAPRPGTEVRCSDLGLSPGGAANVAVALARLGIEVRLSSAFADDAFGAFLWGALEHEGIDLSSSWRVAGWTTPLTVSMAYGRERSMVTHEAALPARPSAGTHRADPGAPTGATPDSGRPEPARACFVALGGELDGARLASLRQRYGVVVADVGWDHEERWSPSLLDQLAEVDVFLPNAAEATAYARQEDVAEAARRLAERGPLVAVKRGAAGALAAGGGLGEVVSEPGIPAEAHDTTGAGDVFDAGFILGTLAGWPVRQRLRFANLCAGESVSYAGGSLSAPCWRDLRAWWERQEDVALREAYGFLPALFEQHRPVRPCERPAARLGTAAH